MKSSVQSLTLAGALLVGTAAQAQSPEYGSHPPSAPEFVFSLGLHFGGEDLATVEYEDGNSDDLEAGGGIYWGAGIEFPLIPDSMAIRASVGYQSDSVNARNGDAEFDRIPWDALVLLGAAPHRLGVGLTYHTDVQYDFHADGGTRIDADFDNALGLAVAYELRFAPNFSVMFQYTDIEYDEKSAWSGGASRSIDGSNGAVTANLLF